MKHKIPHLILFLFLNQLVYAQSTVKVKSTYDYLLYLPKEYTKQTATYPLVIYLHGGSQKGKDLNKLKAYGLPHLVDKGTDYPFIIASPQCPDNKYWSTDNWFENLYKDLVSKYRVDTSRIYVTGISMGGFGAWQVAMDYPDTFAAVVPLCGGCNDSTQICRMSHVPVWTFHGTADDQIPVSETERLVNRLEKCNGNVTFTRLNGEGHGIQYVYENKAIFDWMLKQKRQPVIHRSR
ncbi:alpha/beta fold hydrolase [Spirosoma knui]